jgi:hypothetical protein
VHPEGKNPVREENAKHGTRDWLLANPAPVEAACRAAVIEGYCSATSVRAGDELTLFVSTNPAADWSVEWYRTGYYGGDGGRLVGHEEPRPGVIQPTPPVGPYRARACEWEPSLTIRIPEDWLSGVYLGKLTEHTSGYQSYVIFIVKDDRPCDLIQQCSDLTWQGYNRWPDLYSLYDDGFSDGMYWGPGVGVSFQRPYGKYRQLYDAPLSEGSGEWLLWELPFSYWAEQLGYDISYTSCLDLDSDPATLRRARGFLSIGHDEYYTRAMFDNLTQAVEDGLNVAFLSGNSVLGQVTHVKHPPRTLIRSDAFSLPEADMIRNQPSLAYLPYEAPDANDLIGSRSTYPVMGGADWTCVLPDHWIFAGSGMKHGDSIPGLVGWETHGYLSRKRDLEIVAAGTVSSAKYGPGPYAATVYAAERGNIVFNAATIYWADGLSEPPGYQRAYDYVPRNGPDSRVQVITKNVLDRFVAAPRLGDLA